MKKASPIGFALLGGLIIAAVTPVGAQELPRLEYDSAHGVFTLWYLGDDENTQSIEIIPPNRVVPDVEVMVAASPVYEYRYVMANRSTAESTQPLWMLQVKCPSPDRVSIEASPDGWKAKVREYPETTGHVCDIWVYHHSGMLEPGDSTDGLVLAARQLPGLVTARAWGEAPERPHLEVSRDIEPEEAELIAHATGTDGGWKEFPMVVPVTSPPPANPVDHLGTVHNDLLDVCELGWIDESRICNSLEKKLVGAIDALERDDPVAARDKLESFLSELDAQRGKHVNENAYWLLYLHGEDILRRI